MNDGSDGAGDVAHMQIIASMCTRRTQGRLILEQAEDDGRNQPRWWFIGPISPKQTQPSQADTCGAGQPRQLPRECELGLSVSGRRMRMMLGFEADAAIPVVLGAGT